MAAEIIEELPKIGSDPKFVFTTNEKRPVSGFSRPKVRLNAKAGIEGWILHDLRRTAATGMARLNIPPHVVDKILNHSVGAIRGVAAIYNRASYIEERKAALEAWGRYVESLVRPSPTNVIPLLAVS
jgi:integrase